MTATVLVENHGTHIVTSFLPSTEAFPLRAFPRRSAGFRRRRRFLGALSQLADSIGTNDNVHTESHINTNQKDLVSHENLEDRHHGLLTQCSQTASNGDVFITHQTSRHVRDEDYIAT